MSEIQETEVVAMDFGYPCALRSAIWATEQCNPGWFCTTGIAWDTLDERYRELGLDATTVQDADACLDKLMLYFAADTPSFQRPLILMAGYVPVPEHEPAHVTGERLRAKAVADFLGITRNPDFSEQKGRVFALAGTRGHVVIAGRKRSPQSFSVRQYWGVAPRQHRAYNTQAPAPTQVPVYRGAAPGSTTLSSEELEALLARTRNNPIVRRF